MTIKGAGDLAEAIPYLLGFHPRASLVLVGLADRQVNVTARIDLAELGTAGGAQELAAVLGRSDSRIAIAAVYDDDDPPQLGRLPWEREIDQLGSDLAHYDLTLLDAILISNGRYFSYFCGVEQCCPTGGRPLPGDRSAAAATATYAGLVAMADRSSLASSLAPPSQEVAEMIQPHIEAAENEVVQKILAGHQERHTRSAKRALFAAARSADSTLFVASQTPAKKQQLAAYAVSLTDTAIRDSLWMAIDARRIDGSPLWQEMLRRLPGPYAAAPAFLFAWAKWREGNGTLARIAAERALSSDPDYSAASLLISALDHGLDPRRTPQLRQLSGGVASVSKTRRA